MWREKKYIRRKIERGAARNKKGVGNDVLAPFETEIHLRTSQIPNPERPANTADALPLVYTGTGEVTSQFGQQVNLSTHSTDIIIEQTGL